MPGRIDSWSTNSFPLGSWIGAHDIGVDTAQLINDKSVSITVTRGSTPLSAQTVRLETLHRQREVQGSGGITHLIDAMALGFKGAPGVTDTDLKPGDRFASGGVNFEVVIVMPATNDSVQAFLKVRA